MIKRVLVANRGEIAVRVMRACRELGISTVAVCSDVDRHARHVREADRVVPLGGRSSRESYLDADRVIEAARKAGVDAVHPGYGFLSESAAFARGCEDAGLIFVGPPAAAIELMGSKPAARALAARIGVPVVPGEVPVAQSDEALEAAVRRIGLPALVKPAAGGGGIGMREVRTADTIAEAVRGARHDAAAAFGDDMLYVERLVERPRHVEVQVFGDRHGTLVHLLERECSLQRRHQKVVEECPSPAVTPALRARMGEAALAVARAAGYSSAGTVEFLLDGEGDAAAFYFLEMNTRLQVEHPVTEAVTGLDLVHAQLRVAQGNRLAWRQDRIAARGHAIECRVYAEDPSAGFLPQAGHVLVYAEPHAPGVRVDGGLEAGDEVPVQFDPLVAKLIAHAEDRPAAIARARAALARFVVLGVRTNTSYLRAVLGHPDFGLARIDTRWLDRVTPSIVEAAAEAPPAAIAAAVAALGAAKLSASSAANAAAGDSSAYDPWSGTSGWRLGA
jgi:acetyl-CoA carboxylase biotin carboxylase subunit